MMKIRAMNMGDYSRVYALWLGTPNMGLNDLDDSENGIEKYLLRNPKTTLVAEEDGAVIGVILCGHDGRRGFIHHTAVAAGFQRRGVGTALVNAALEALKDEGINKASLVVFDRNGGGNDFWAKQGFTAREDLVYRNKALTELRRIDT